MAGSTRAISPGTWLPGAAAAAVLATLAIAPVLALWGVGQGSGALGPADWAAIRFTLLQSFLSASLSVALAIPFARALARRSFPGRRALVSLLGAPFLLPAIVAILGLLAVWGRAGLVSDASQALGGPLLSIYGLTGVVLAHVFFNLALVTRLLLQGWQAIPAERYRLAGQLGLPPGAMFRLIEAPMLRAVLPGAFLLVFLLCMTSFAVALALGGGPRATTIELAIYQALRFDFDLAAAARLALVQFALCGAVAGVALAVARPIDFGRGLGRFPQRWDAPGGWRRRADIAVILLGLLFLLPPLGMVAARGLGALLSGLPPGLVEAALTSLALATASATLAVGAALALAALITALPRARGAAVEGVGLLMLAASPFVIGTGLFILINPIADPFALALVITGVINAAMSLPFGLRALVPAMASVQANYGRLAESLGLSGWRRARLVTWPLLRGPLGFAAGLSAALSMGDLGVITLFAPPGVETLPLYMYRLMGAYRMEDAAGAALVLVILSFGLFWLCDRGGRLGSDT